MGKASPTSWKTGCQGAAWSASHAPVRAHVRELSLDLDVVVLAAMQSFPDASMSAARTKAVKIARANRAATSASRPLRESLTDALMNAVRKAVEIARANTTATQTSRPCASPSWATAG